MAQGKSNIGDAGQMSGVKREVHRGELVATLSLATDLAMGQPMGFGLRSCLASVALADRLGLAAADRLQTYYQALLRYAGCTGQTDMLVALFGDEIALRQDFARLDAAQAGQLLPVVFRHLVAAGEGRNPLAFLGGLIQGMVESRGTSALVFEAHCEVAGRLAQRLGLPAAVAGNLGQLYERWDGKGQPNGLSGEAVAPAVRVVSLVQDALVLLGVLPREQALATLLSRRGGAYDPQIVDALLADPDLLAPVVEDDALFGAVLAAAPEPDPPLSAAGIDAAAEVIADFIDLKSPVIAGHSRAVAALAAAAAENAGLPAGDVADLRRAGLLHDLGYMAIPARLRLASASSGDKSEQGRLHPYYGERLLARSVALSPIGAIIAEHHERLDGSGFHRGIKGTQISLSGRILAAAESYQSLIENRPFRVTQTPAQAAGTLNKAAREGSLDPIACRAVLDAAGHHLRSGKPVFAAGLTAREIEVLRLVAAGQSTKQVARLLELSPKTVDNHVQSIYAKAEVRTRAGATLFAIEHGLLRPGAEP